MRNLLWLSVIGFVVLNPFLPSLFSQRMADTSASIGNGLISGATTNVGNLGVPNRFIEPGDSGFAWKGRQYLKEASLMIGVEPERVSDAARFIFGLAQDNLDRDFRPLSSVTIAASNSDSIIHLTTFDDSLSNMAPGYPSQPIGLRVTQTSSLYSSAGDNGYLIVRLDLQNGSNRSLSNVLLGWLVDWNIEGLADRGGVVTFDQQFATLNDGDTFPSSIAYQKASSASGPFLGIVSLSQSRFRAARVASVRNEISPSASNGGLTESNKYAYMSANRTVDPMGDGGVEEDLLTIASVGGLSSGSFSSSSFSIDPGGMVVVAFAFVGGDDSLSLIGNARKAQLHWLRNGGAMEVVPTSWTVSADWNMISLPVEVTNGARKSLFPTALSEAYFFTPESGYVWRDTVRTGVGYWVKFPSDQSITIDGTLRLSDTLTVFQGWNLIGSLSYPLSTSSIRTEPDGILSSSFFGFDESYMEVEFLQPMRSYWIKILRPGLIILRDEGR